MTPTVATEAFTSFLVHLVNPAARALVLAVAAGIGLAAFRVKTVSVRLFTWTTVLYAAVAMPLLGWVLPPLSISTPAFLQQAAEKYNTVQPIPAETHTVPPLAVEPKSTISEVVALRAEIIKSTSAEVTSPQASEAVVRTDLSAEAAIAPVAPEISPSHPRAAIRWTTIAVAIYLAVAFLLLARLFIGIAFGRRLMRASQVIDEPRLTRRLASRARASGLAFVPQAAESEFISVPVTMGAWRSIILVPTGWLEWDDAKLDAVVAHEMSHVARRDALTQYVSLLHRAIFWFSPLAWWLNRHLTNFAEQASDEAALSSGINRKDYARTLLGFFEALQSAPGRVWWQGVSMAQTGQAEQRVERILDWKGSVAMHFTKSIAIVVVVLAVPVVYLAASVRAANHIVGAHGVSLAQAPTAPAAPVAPTAATAAARVAAARAVRASKAATARGSSYAYGYDDNLHFVISSVKNDSLTMSGSSDDAEMVQELKKTIPGDFIWFKRDGKSYLIRDQSTVERAKKFWAPEEELGKQQEELGKQQEALGKQQEELSAKMEQIKVNVPDMTADLDQLKAELKQLSSSATMEQIGEVQSKIGDLQSKLGDIQSQAGEQQSKVGDLMGALGEKQGKLGEQQGKLGERQGELAEQASRQMKQLLDEALAKGTAQPQQ